MYVRAAAVLFILLSCASFAEAASFDCNAASVPLEKTLCGDAALGKADEAMAQYYTKLRESLGQQESEALLKEQRAWLASRAKSCSATDAACLKKLYDERTHALRAQYEHLVPFTVPTGVSLQGLVGTCEIPGLKLPSDAAIYATGWYSGRKLSAQIDQSGHEATQFDVIVNSPEKPVALVLGAYEPSIWNIGWTKGTRILAVVASGYHRQAVAGLPNDTPILISSYDNKGPCGYDVAERNLESLNPFATKIFGKPVDMVYFARNGTGVVGPAIAPNEQLFTSKDAPPEKFIDTSMPKAGLAGLQEAVEKGILRPATAEDLAAWKKKKAELAPKNTVPPVANPEVVQRRRQGPIHNGYVILKPFRIPAGLYGGHLATFILPEGVPYPTGELGHSALYDFNTMTCRGAVCEREN